MLQLNWLGIGKAVGVALAAAAVFVALQEYKGALRREGASQAVLALQVKQTQLWKRDSEAKDHIMIALEMEKDAIEKKANRARSLVKELESRKVVVGAPDAQTEVDFSECRIPDDVYRRLCEQLPCSADSLRAAPRID